MKILTNGYIPILPILLWNLVFTTKLPEAYRPFEFNRDIPLIIALGENIFRGIIFVLPAGARLNITSKIGKTGLFVYLLGSLIYYASWLALMYFPQGAWSKNFIGFLAPAYLPIIWLLGIAYMFDSYYFRFNFKRWHFILPSVIFAVFHITHATIVYARNY